MVKNKTGGSRHKKQARKNQSVPVSRRLRVPKEEGEILAKVIKVNGNGMYDVICEDKVTRLLVLRKKFKGRNKRDNNITLNSVLLIGRRLWEVVHPKKKQKVDLLYVYSNHQLDDLRQKITVSSLILPEDMKEEDENAFDMSRKNNWEDKADKTILGAVKEMVVNNAKSSENKKLTTNQKISKSDVKKDFDFDFDDI